MKKSLLFLFAFAIHSVSMGVQVSKPDWITGMTTAVPAHFCRPAAYFRQCFGVAVAECEEVASSATRLCLSKYQSQIPAVLNQPDDGNKWGGVVGGCAGQTYEVTLISKRISNPKCNDPSNWK